jgi:hypothetical protein
MSRLAVAAIQEYYTQHGLGDHYFMLANDPSLDDKAEFMRLSEKHIQLAKISYDYILTNFKMDLDEASGSIKEHLAKDFTTEQAH